MAMSSPSAANLPGTTGQNPVFTQFATARQAGFNQGTNPPAVTQSSVPAFNQGPGEDVLSLNNSTSSDPMPVAGGLPTPPESANPGDNPFTDIKDRITDSLTTLSSSLQG